VTLSGKDTLLGPHGSAASRAKYNSVVADDGENGAWDLSQLTSVLIAFYNASLRFESHLGP
jgi:hypothetical protein